MADMFQEILVPARLHRLFWSEQIDIQFGQQGAMCTLLRC